MVASQQTIEQRLAEFTEVHGTVLLGMHRELQSQLRSVDERLAVATEALHADADRIAVAARRALEDSEQAGRGLSELVDKTRDETGALVKTAAIELNQRLQSAVGMFNESYATFSRQLETVEAKILTYMVKQQQLLDGQAQEIHSLYTRTQQLLADADKKIDAHQRREADFNRRLRRSLLALAVVTCVGVIVGIWKPWIN